MHSFNRIIAYAKGITEHVSTRLVMSISFVLSQLIFIKLLLVQLITLLIILLIPDLHKPQLLIFVHKCVHHPEYI